MLKHPVLVMDSDTMVMVIADINPFWADRHTTRVVEWSAIGFTYGSMDMAILGQLEYFISAAFCHPKVVILIKCNTIQTISRVGIRMGCALNGSLLRSRR